WLKLTRRPLTWVLLAIFLALLVLQLVTQAVFANLLDGASGGLAAQAGEYQRRSMFPGLFGSALGHLNSLGGIFAVILAAGALGSEYGWGTLRTQLARQPNRSRYLLAKIITLLFMLVIAAAITIALAALVGGLIGLVTGQVGALGPGDLARLPLGLARAVFVLVPYMLLAICFTLLGRSLLAGVAGGLVYLVVEGGFGALAAFAQLGGVWPAIYNLTIGQNINTLVVLNSHDFGLYPEQLSPAFQLDALPSPLQATLVVAAYSLSLLASALFLFRRRDIEGPR
ncbi:MAG TPA: ABC transporter permease, partial [Roseiflexaceae bacterium]|nr:ABC transporter permease [Roseiflexaceae bacterium]